MRPRVFLKVDLDPETVVQRLNAALDRLRRPTNGYTPLEKACPKCRAAMDGRHDLEKDRPARP